MTTFMESAVERMVDGLWQRQGHVFSREQNNGLFALLAGVRNYAKVVPISHPRGLPVDYGPYDAAYFSKCHTTSWLYSHELMGIGKVLVPGGESMCDFLGIDACRKIEHLTAVRGTRLVFGFWEG